MGISPLLKTYKDIPKKQRDKYSLPLKYWHFATHYPVQEKCCTILKKYPAKKINKNLIVGIMKESPARIRAIRDTFKGKYFPLQNWTKNDVLNYLRLNNIPHSDSYKDKTIERAGDTIILKGATNTGCQECHFGQTVNHDVVINGVLYHVTKFEKMRLLKPKAYEIMMNRTHKPTGITYRETIEAFEDSKRGKYLKESIKIRNEYIEKILILMRENKKGYVFHPKAEALLKSYIVSINSL